MFIYVIPQTHVWCFCMLTPFSAFHESFIICKPPSTYLNTGYCVLFENNLKAETYVRVNIINKSLAIFIPCVILSVHFGIVILKKKYIFK